jgi:hypothetical protein
MAARRYLAVAGGIAGLIVAAVTVAGFLIQVWKSDASLELVSAQVSETGREIDVKVLNSGGQVAFVHRARFMIAEHHFTPGAAKGLPASWTYDVEFPIERSARSVDVELSQAIGPGEPDRITLKAGVAPPVRGAPGGIHRYETSVVFFYNQPAKELRVGPLSLSLLSVARSGETPPKRLGRPDEAAPIGERAR